MNGFVLRVDAVRRGWQATSSRSNAVKELYSRHKDRDPQGTVDGIVEILEQAGLDTEMRWTSHPFEGLCSNRVTIA
jgi:hypothetical protein